jgi:hypothetical protein
MEASLRGGLLRYCVPMIAMMIAALLADGIYIGGGFLLLIVIIILVILLWRRRI